MKRVSMSGSLRGSVGKKDAKSLRRQGRVPCVLYGGKEQIHFSLETKAFKPLIETTDAAFVKLNIEGKEVEATLQDMQFHPVSDNIYHADFLEIIDNKELIMSIPVEVQGTAPGIISGGKLIKKMRYLRVRALPVDMIEKIIVNISKLNIGDSITVGEISIDKVAILDNPRSVVVMVKTTRGTVGGDLDEDEESEETGDTKEGAEKTEEGKQQE